MTYLNRRLASRTRARAALVRQRVQAAANAADRVAGQVWGQVLRLLQDRPHWAEAYQRALPIFARLLPMLLGQIGKSLQRTARWAHRATVQDLERVLPEKALLAAASRRMLREDEGPTVTLSLQDLLGPLWHGVGAPSGPILKDPSALLRSVLFPIPTAAEVHAVIYSSGWTQRLAAATRLAAPQQLADTLAAGLARGETPRQIAQRLLPVVDGVRTSAMRIARTEGMRVAHSMQMKMHEQLGDLVIGYQIVSAHSPNSRTWHVKRSGTIYYKDPGPGQKSYAQMPQPPEEAPDPNERPPGTPQVAYN